MNQLKNELIKSRDSLLNSYKRDIKLMLSAYKHEIDTVKGYNGRQILELFQNCDDEESTEVLLKLDEDNKLFSISNNGNPFLIEGYNSLLYSNLSSKVSGKFIGNKGLGFRSIINWAEEIRIFGNGFCVEFSKDVLKQAFLDNFNKYEREELLKERNYQSDVVPLPFLSFPNIKDDVFNNDFTTTIEVKYKEEYLDSIKNQAKSLRSETLLFLNHIETVKFDGFENVKDIQIESRIKLDETDNSTSPIEIIIINNKTWNIVEEEAELEDKFQNKESLNKEFYQLKIAYQDDLSDDINLLFSYFLTEEDLSFPFLIHGTFELDQNRKRITNDESGNEITRNQFIQLKLVKLIINTALNFTKNELSWKPLSFLSYKSKNPSLITFFKTLDSEIFKEKLYPCIDGKYRKKEDCKYLSNKFAEMVLDVGLESYFPNHVLSYDEDKIDLSGLSKEIPDIKDIIANISLADFDFKKRAILIKQLVEEFPNTVFDFLIDKKGALITGTDHVFTSETSDRDLKTPSFTDIKFIHKDLFNALIEVFAFEDQFQETERGVFITKYLKGNCNVHNFRATPVALEIVRKTDYQIRINPDKELDYVREMNECLFNNFLQTNESSKGKSLYEEITKIPSLNNQNKVSYTENLTFSNAYPAGKNASLVFGENPNISYVSHPEKLGLPLNHNINEVEEYLRWIGVSEFINLTPESNYWERKNYINWYCENNNCTSEDFEGETFKISNFTQILANISLDQFVFWILTDDNLRRQIDDNYNKDTLKIKRPSWITIKPSYLKYQIDKYSRFNFKNHLIEENLDWTNEHHVNYNNSIFIDNNLTKENINTTLILLGAKRDFNDLSIKRVKEIINNIHKHFIDGRNATTIYKKALGHYAVHKQKLDGSVYLFADNGIEKKLYHNSYEVYFSDKIKLPKRLKQNYPIFHYPISSSNKDLITFFHIRSLENVRINILRAEIVERINNEFQAYFEYLKPIILAIRISNLESKAYIESQISALNKIDIKLCSAVVYQIGIEEIESLDFEYLLSNDKNYLKIPDFFSLDSLLQNYHFIGAVAEILSNAFEVGADKKDFIYLMRANKDNIQSFIENEIGIDTLNQAKSSLGLLDNKFVFWKAIFNSKGEVFEYKLDDVALGKLVKETFDIEFNVQSINYDLINHKYELQNVLKLLELLDIEVLVFNNNSSNQLDFSIIHKQKLLDVLTKNKLKVISSIWKSTNKKSTNEKKNFLGQLVKYDNSSSYINDVCNLNSNSFRIDEESIVNEFIKKIYPDISIEEEFDFSQEKRHNYLYLTQEEILRVEENENLKSLVYFQSELNIIREELSKPIPIITIPKFNEEDYEVVILDSSILKPTDRSLIYHNSNVFTPRLTDAFYKKNKGNNCEDIVFKHITNTMGLKALHESKLNEGKHYDISYQNADNVTKYIEVKAFDSGKFFLSKEEYDFGKENIEHYEIWLVSNYRQIIPIIDFFNNPKYQIRIKEYVVYLDKVN